MRMADVVSRKLIQWAPKSVREAMDQKVEADANRLNAAILDAQGFMRCHVCPERFGGGLRVRHVAGRDLYFCPVHARSLDAGILVVR